jgi:type I restriction enzyme S subunit
LKKEEFQTTGDYMLITGTDFENGQINYSTCVYVSKERYDMDPNIQVKNGDILITKDGTIGKVAIVHDLPMPATLNAGVFVLRPDGRFNVGFFSYIFQGPIFADFVDVVKTGTTIKHLNQGKLKQFEIPLASEESQKEFSELYRQGDKSKVALQKAIGDLDAMYKRILKDNLG